MCQSVSVVCQCVSVVWTCGEIRVGKLSGSHDTRNSYKERETGKVPDGGSHPLLSSKQSLAQTPVYCRLIALMAVRLTGPHVL